VRKLGILTLDKICWSYLVFENVTEVHCNHNVYNFIAGRNNFDSGLNMPIFGRQSQVLDATLVCQIFSR